MKKKRARDIQYTSDGSSSDDCTNLHGRRKLKNLKAPRKRLSYRTAHGSSTPRGRRKNSVSQSSSSNSDTINSHNGLKSPSRSRSQSEDSRNVNFREEENGHSFYTSNSNTSTSSRSLPLKRQRSRDHARVPNKNKTKTKRQNVIKENKIRTRDHTHRYHHHAPNHNNSHNHDHQYTHGRGHAYGKRKHLGVVKKPCIIQPCCCPECDVKAWCVTISMLEMTVPLTIILSNMVMFESWSVLLGRWSDDYYTDKSTNSSYPNTQIVYFWIFFVVMALCIFCGSLLMIGVYWKSKVFCLAHSVLALILALKIFCLFLLAVVLYNKAHLLAVITNCATYIISASLFVYFSLCSTALFTHIRAGVLRSAKTLDYPISRELIQSKNNVGGLGSAMAGHGDLERIVLNQDNFVLSFLKYGIHS